MKKLLIGLVLISICLSFCACTNNQSASKKYNNYDYISSTYTSSIDTNSNDIDSYSTNDIQSQDNNNDTNQYNTESEYSASNNLTQDITETVLDDEKGACWALAEDVVTANLESPSSAKFPFSYGDEGVSFSKSGNTYTVMGWVDAQNSYGATLRNNFIVTMTKSEYGSNAKFTANSCNIG